MSRRRVKRLGFFASPEIVVGSGAIGLGVVVAVASSAAEGDGISESDSAKDNKFGLEKIECLYMLM